VRYKVFSRVLNGRRTRADCFKLLTVNFAHFDLIVLGVLLLNDRVVNLGINCFLIDFKNWELHFLLWILISPNPQFKAIIDYVVNLQSLIEESCLIWSIIASKSALSPSLTTFLSTAQEDATSTTLIICILLIAEYSSNNWSRQLWISVQGINSSWAKPN